MKIYISTLRDITKDPNLVISLIGVKASLKDAEDICREQFKDMKLLREYNDVRVYSVYPYEKYHIEIEGMDLKYEKTGSNYWWKDVFYGL